MSLPDTLAPFRMRLVRAALSLVCLGGGLQVLAQEADPPPQPATPAASGATPAAPDRASVTSDASPASTTPAPGQAEASAATAAPIVVEGQASFYARRFSGRRTASGEVFDPQAFTMAHRSWPFGTAVRVTHLLNGRSVVVRVNDRGPHVRQRIADLSPAAARTLGMLQEGITRVRLEVLTPSAAAR